MSVRKRTWKTSKGEVKETWVVTYVDKGKRRQKTFERKKDADAWSVNTLHEVSLGIHTPASESWTVEEAGEQWIANAEKLETSTIKQRREHLNIHI